MQRFFPFSFSGALGAGLLALGTLLAAGCQKHHEVPQALAEAPASARLAGGAAAPAELARAREDSAAEAPAERFLAVRHDLSVEVAPDKLPEAWASVPRGPATPAGSRVRPSLAPADQRRSPPRSARSRQ